MDLDETKPFIPSEGEVICRGQATPPIWPWKCATVGLSTCLLLVIWIAIWQSIISNRSTYDRGFDTDLCCIIQQYTLEACTLANADHEQQLQSLRSGSRRRASQAASSSTLPANLSSSWTKTADGMWDNPQGNSTQHGISLLV